MAKLDKQPVRNEAYVLLHVCCIHSDEVHRESVSNELVLYLDCLFCKWMNNFFNFIYDSDMMSGLVRVKVTFGRPRRTVGRCGRCTGNTQSRSEDLRRAI